MSNCSLTGGAVVDVKLSSRGLNNITAVLDDSDFEFIVGGKRYKYNSFVAEFLSPKISRLRKSDPSVLEYKLETRDSSSRFGRFLSLPFESTLHVDPESFDFFVSVSKELENEELLTQLTSGYLDSTEITTSKGSQ